MGKPELKLQYLDEWMVRWKKFQTESDWKIEKSRQWWRKFDMVCAAGVAGVLTMYTAGNATIRRQFGPPHFFDMGYDVRFKEAVVQHFTSGWRYTPQGYGRLAIIAIPTYVVFAVLEHQREKKRLKKYLRQQTVFGEQARRLIATGKIEEFLPVNIHATLPEVEQRSLYH